MSPRPATGEAPQQGACPPQLESPPLAAAGEDPTVVKPQRSREQTHMCLGRVRISDALFLTDSFAKQRHTPPTEVRSAEFHCQEVSQDPPVNPALFCGYRGEQHEQDHALMGKTSSRQASSGWCCFLKSEMKRRT